MDQTGNQPVSRARYEREKLARLEAEALLDSKSRELYEANQRLILETEAVRAALAETEALRARETGALREQRILSHCLAALSGKSGATEAMQSLLDVLQRDFEIFDACFLQAAGGEIRVFAAAQAEHANLLLPLSTNLLHRPRRINNLASLAVSKIRPRPHPAQKAR